jgi:hypothetical protein
MTKIILSFPVRRTAPLACMWVRTGNPAQPLVCRWVSQSELDVSPQATEAEGGVEIPTLCVSRCRAAGAGRQKINSNTLVLDPAKKGCIGVRRRRRQGLRIILMVFGPGVIVTASDDEAGTSRRALSMACTGSGFLLSCCRSPTSTKDAIRKIPAIWSGTEPAGTHPLPAKEP